MFLRTVTLTLCLAGCSATNHQRETIAQEAAMSTTTLGNTIFFKPRAGRADDLRALLGGAGTLVAESEPRTDLWYALEDEADGGFAIFDLFADRAAREQHFAGQVAAALRDQAPALVEGGWESGVLAGVTHYELLAPPVRRPTLAEARIAGYIPLRPRPGQGEELAALLRAGRDMVDSDEPQTLLWVPLRNENGRDFAIVDLFADVDGLNAHFAGRTAAALKARAEDLVEGGWDGITSAARTLRIRSTNVSQQAGG